MSVIERKFLIDICDVIFFIMLTTQPYVCLIRSNNSISKYSEVVGRNTRPARLSKFEQNQRNCNQIDLNIFSSILCFFFSITSHMRQTLEWIILNNFAQETLGLKPIASKRILDEIQLLDIIKICIQVFFSYWHRPDRINISYIQHITH